METSKNLLLMFLFSFSSVQAKDCWVTGRCQVPILLSLHDKYTANVYRGLRVSVVGCCNTIHFSIHKAVRSCMGGNSQVFNINGTFRPLWGHGRGQHSPKALCSNMYSNMGWKSEKGFVIFERIFAIVKLCIDKVGRELLRKLCQLPKD